MLSKYNDLKNEVVGMIYDDDYDALARLLGKDIAYWIEYTSEAIRLSAQSEGYTAGFEDGKAQTAAETP